MSKISLSIYRLPTPRAARIGAARMVIDRNQQVYLAGSRVESTAPSGEFLIVTTKFRGTNALGGVVTNWVTAKCDLEGNVVSVISRGP